MKYFQCQKILNGTPSLSRSVSRMGGGAPLTNAVPEDTPTPRSCLRLEDVDLPNGRALIHARRCVAVDRTTSASPTDFRGVGPDAFARTIGHAETNACR